MLDLGGGSKELQNSQVFVTTRHRPFLFRFVRLFKNQGSHCVALVMSRMRFSTKPRWQTKGYKSMNKTDVAHQTTQGIVSSWREIYLYKIHNSTKCWRAERQLLWIYHVSITSTCSSKSKTKHIV